MNTTKQLAEAARKLVNEKRKRWHPCDPTVNDLLAALAAWEAEQAQQAAQAQPEPHLFEFWWERYMPNATQAEAWEAWQAAPRADGVGVAQAQPEAVPAGAFWQGGLTNEELAEHWQMKCPGAPMKDRDWAKIGRAHV